jgi:hypothetical protein
MANDIANLIYNIALSSKKHDIANSTVKIEFVHGFEDGYEMATVIDIYRDDDEIVLRYKGVCVTASLPSFNILVQKILVDFLEILARQSRIDSFVSDFSYIFINIHNKTLVSSCKYLFSSCLNSDNIVNFNTWYANNDLYNLQHFISIHYYFAYGIVKARKICNKVK